MVPACQAPLGHAGLPITPFEINSLFLFIFKGSELSASTGSLKQDPGFRPAGILAPPGNLPRPTLMLYPSNPC